MSWRWQRLERVAGRSGSLPWARPRFELALLALVAVATLTPLAPSNPQDQSRMCLAQALTHGRLSNDACLAGQSDFASYGGHLYTDKAPGLSLIELPSVALLHPLPPSHHKLDFRLWLTRVLSVGLALLACAFLVGRVAEGIAPGFGSITLVTFALGTIVGSLAQLSFEHVPAALALFGTFLLAWARKPFLAGLAGGAAILIEYEAGISIVLFGAYVAVRGLPGLLRYVTGVLPGAVLLAAYDWAAFGAPWRLSYRYVSSDFLAKQSSGFFGIGIPSASGLFAVLSGNGGVLFVSPVLVLAGYGLFRLRGRYPLEMLVSAAVVVLMALLDSGYWLPYGGTSPGPRYVAPAIPFLALGLAAAFAWRPRLTLVLAIASIATTTAIDLVWANGTFGMRNTVWGELLRVPSSRGASIYSQAMVGNVVSELGPGKWLGAVVVVMAALAALVLGIRSMPWRSIREARARPAEAGSRRRRLLVVVLVVLGLAAIDASAVFGYPYGNGFQPRRTPATITISGSPRSSYTGGEVNFRVQVRNDSDYLLLPSTVVTFYLSPGMNLVGPPQVTIGNGCTGAGPIVCHLNYLPPDLTAMINFGIQFTDPGAHELRARLTSDGFAAPAPPPYWIGVGD
jgi:hypothetical protein